MGITIEPHAKGAKTRRDNTARQPNSAPSREVAICTGAHKIR